MKSISAICVLALAMVLSGCTPAVSIRPLYTEADLKKPVVEPRIEGEWVRFDEENGDGDKWKIAHSSNDTYDIEFRPAKPDPKKGEEVSEYYIRLVSIGDKLFFDGQFWEQSEGQVTTRSDEFYGLAPAHIIGGIWVHPDYLRMTFVDSEWTEKHSPDSFHEAAGHGEGDNLAVITASTQEVRDFLVRAQDEEGAILSMYLCRAGVDCAMRWAEDELSRLPKDEERRDEILKKAALFFLVGGNYDRSLQLQRRRLESKPEDSTVREDIGRTLLFNKDFQVARSEFAAIQKSAEQKFASATKDWERDEEERAAAEAAEGVVWSYFIEGDHAGAVTAFANYKGANGFFSVNPILLSYFSLRRLGNPRKAEAFLKEQSGKFKGPADDHLLLLDVQNKLIEPGALGWHPDKGDNLQRFYFYRALGWVASGDVDSARSNLQSALGVADAPKDSLAGLAAKVELERLGPPKK
jgi:hypothetical protein